MNQPRPEANPTAALAEALTEVQGGNLASWMRRAPLILAALDAAGWSLVSTRDREDEAWFMQKETDRLRAEIDLMRSILALLEPTDEP